MAPYSALRLPVELTSRLLCISMMLNKQASRAVWRSRLRDVVTIAFFGRAPPMLAMLERAYALRRRVGRLAASVSVDVGSFGHAASLAFRLRCADLCRRVCLDCSAAGGAGSTKTCVSPRCVGCCARLRGPCTDPLFAVCVVGGNRAAPPRGRSGRARRRLRTWRSPWPTKTTTPRWVSPRMPQMPRSRRPVSFLDVDAAGCCLIQWQSG